MSTFEIRPSLLGCVVVATAAPPPFAVVYTTRDFDGVLDDSSVARVEQLLFECTGVRRRLATCRQVHGDVAVSVVSSKEARCDVGECDALITASPEVALGIKVADCLPVSLVFPERRVVANVHAGWRGAASDIVSKTLAAVKDAHGVEAGEAIAFLGPSIRRCCFEVGEEVIEAFERRFGSMGDFTDRSPGARPHFDLVGQTAGLLRLKGVAEERIHDSGFCTRCDDSIFHSYRRDGKRAGRNLALVAQ
jgi:polyphenol oxidase